MMHVHPPGGGTDMFDQSLQHLGDCTADGDDAGCMLFCNMFSVPKTYRVLTDQKK